MAAPVPYPLVIAHRGASQARPEHTLGAYRLAIEQGASALECDVRLSADGELVCLHDRNLERTGGGATGIVSTMTVEQLRAVDWGAWRANGAGPVADDPESGRLVTLRELVELALGAGREIGLAIETKHPTRSGGKVEHEVARVLGEYGLAGGGLHSQVWARVMSFSALAVRRMAGLTPTLPLVFLVSASAPLPHRAGSLPPGSSTAGLDVALLRERPEVVAAHHEAGHQVWVWTVDEDDDVRRCLDTGVEAVITNRPDHVLDLVGGNS